MRKKTVDVAAWSAFLNEIVSLRGEGGKLTLTEVDNALIKLTGRSGNARAQIKQYLEGKQPPRAYRVFWVGEALRRCGVPWVSGALALRRAGFTRERITLLEALDQQDATACRWFWRAEMIQGLDDLPVDVAQAELAVCWEQIGDRLIDAWDTMHTKRFRARGLAAVLLDLADRTDIDEDDRVEAGEALMEIWKRRHPMFEAIERDVEALSGQVTSPAEVA